MHAYVGKAVTAVALLGLVLEAGQASAASEPTPAAPSLTITTSAASTALPVSGMQGAWKVSRPGAKAELNLSGKVVTGTVTTVTAAWTSGWIRPRPHTSRRPRLQVSVEDEHDSLLPGPADNHWSTVVYYRTSPSARWTSWLSVGLDDPFDVMLSTVQGFAGVGWVEVKQVQFRITLKATLDDTSSTAFTGRVEALS